MIKALAVLMAVGLLAIPAVIGAFTENGIRRHAENVSPASEAFYDLDVVDYDSGWFDSTARLQANLTPDYLEQIVAVATQDDDDNSAAIAGLMIRSILGQSLPLQLEIEHGPILTSGGFRIGILSTVIRPDPATDGLPELQEMLGVPYLFEIRTLKSIGGESSYTADVPPIALDYLLAQLDFSGLDVTGNFDLPSRTVSSAGGIGYLRATAGGQGSINVENIAFQTDVVGYDAGLWLGDVLTEIENVNIDGFGPQGPFNVSMQRAGATFESELDDSGTLVSIEGNYYVDSLTSEALADVAEQLNLSDARFDVSLRNFSLAALEEYYAYGQLVRNDPRSAPPLIPGVQDMLYLTLSTSPEIRVGPIEFAWDSEPFRANLIILIDAASLPPREDFNMLDIRTLLGAISVEGHLAMSERIATLLAEQAAMRQLRSSAAANGAIPGEEDLAIMAEKQAIVMLLGLVSRGMLVADDDGYRAELFLNDGQLTLNGDIIPLGIPL